MSYPAGGLGRFQKEKRRYRNRNVGIVVYDKSNDHPWILC